jgi:predicted site-specific integrase-resolvase
MGSPLLRIGQAAQRAGVSTDTIRYYERLGLLPKPQRSSLIATSAEALATTREEAVAAA